MLYKYMSWNSLGWTVYIHTVCLKLYIQVKRTLQGFWVRGPLLMCAEEAPWVIHLHYTQWDTERQLPLRFPYEGARIFDEENILVH